MHRIRWDSFIDFWNQFYVETKFKLTQILSIVRVVERLDKEVMNQNAGTFILHSEINIYSSYFKTRFVLSIFSNWMNRILCSITGIVCEILHFIYLNCCYIAIIINGSTQRPCSEEKINK